jgi:outer membrane protein TolC
MIQPFSKFSTIHRRAALLLAVAGLALTGVVTASEVPTTVTEDPEIPELSGLGLADAGERAEITLEEAVTAALRRNLGLVVERYRRSQTIQGIREALGIYDLQIDADSSLSENTSPTTTALEATDVLVQRFSDLNVSLTQLTPYGGTASLSFDNSRFSSTNLFVNPNPQFGVGLDLSFTQPLLRNFGRTVTEQNLIVARTNAEISREDFYAQVQGVVQQVADSYWTLVEAREQLAVAEESLDLAEELHGMNRIQVEVGTLAPLELVQSEAGVATREEDIIRRRAAVEDAADNLRRLVNIERLDLWNVEIVPVTDPEIEHQPIDVREAVKIAFGNRPDVRSQLLTIKNREIDAEVAENQKLPQLDLTASWGYNGVGGDIRDTDTGAVLLEGDYGDALQQILDTDFKGWRVAAVFSYPLQNRSAKARATIAELALEQADFELKDLKQQVVTEVRQAARGVDTAAKQIESAKVSSKLARKNLEAERKRYENGLSTSFQVLEIQEDLSQARSREVSAVITYRRALTEYRRSVGKLLEAYGIELATDAPAESAE